MTREDLIKLKQDNRDNLVIYNLMNVIIGECDRLGKNISKDLIIQVMQKLYKNNKLTIAETIENPNNSYTIRTQELCQEVAFLDQFIPKQLDESELRDIISCFVDANDTTNIGSIMQFFKANYQGLYDGSVVSKIAKELMSK